MKALDRALCALVVAALAAGPSQVVATTSTASNTFNFTVNLTATCLFSTVSNFTVNYTSFTTAPTVSNQGFTVQCTNSLPYFLSLTGGTEAGTTGAYTATGTNTNIAHTITVNIDNSGALTALGSATGRTGSGSTQTYALSTTVDVTGATCAAPNGSSVCSDTTAHTIVATF